MSMDRTDFVKVCGLAAVAAVVGLAPESKPSIPLSVPNHPDVKVRHEHFTGMNDLPEEEISHREALLERVGEHTAKHWEWVDESGKVVHQTKYPTLTDGKEFTIVPTFGFNEKGDVLSRVRQRKGEVAAPLDIPAVAKGIAANMEQAARGAPELRNMTVVTSDLFPNEIGICMYKRPLFKA